jgi:hypothetical protein
MPKRSSTVGAMSWIWGSFTATRRLQKNTPGTNRWSMQWSALHALSLSEKTAGAIVPVTESHEHRNPGRYPTIRSGPF